VHVTPARATECARRATVPRDSRLPAARVTGFMALSSLSRSCFSHRRYRANRVLPCPESLADLRPRVLQELIGPTQGIAAAVEHLHRVVVT
jgi:hypothetical protein